jgi:hypothetical protein
MFWNDEIKMEILSYSQYHLDAIITGRDCDPWRFTCVYGEARTLERFKTWDMLKFVRSSSVLPWMCIGNFNKVLHQHEHDGMADCSLARIEGFCDMVDVCELADLGYKGKSWTFKNRVVGGSFCRVRLDRALATAP